MEQTRPGAMLPMPTDAEIKAEKQQQLANKSGTTTTSELVIPEIPRVDLPADVAKRFPTLADWNRRHYEAWSDWRQRVNVALTRRFGSG